MSRGDDNGLVYRAGNVTFSPTATDPEGSLSRFTQVKVPDSISCEVVPVEVDLLESVSD